jgi:uncharacterized damage-inducible protein DinB
MSQTATPTPAATIAAADAMLGQCRAFLAALDRGIYATPCEVMHGGTIGQHVRHALDHFRAALAGLDGACVDYDHRERDTDVERDAGAALAEIDRLRGRLGALGDDDAGRAVTIRVMLTSGGETAELPSSLARELVFASHHAVHHHAMIGAIARALGAEPPADFGKAPSTLEHERAARR